MSFSCLAFSKLSRISSIVLSSYAVFLLGISKRLMSICSLIHVFNSIISSFVLIPREGVVQKGDSLEGLCSFLYCLPIFGICFHFPSVFLLKGFQLLNFLRSEPSRTFPCFLFVVLHILLLPFCTVFAARRECIKHYFSEIIVPYGIIFFKEMREFV